MGGKFHPKLNTGERPIANKYREGKVKRTLKRELKVLETVGREGVSTSIHLPENQRSWVKQIFGLSRDHLRVVLGGLFKH